MTDWTPTEIEIMKQLCPNISVPELCSRLGRSREQVRWQLRRLGLRTRASHVRPANLRRDVHTHARLYGAASAAQRYGMSENAVQLISRRYRKQSDNPPEAIQDLYQRALSVGNSAGLGEYSTDFAAWCVLQVLEGNEFPRALRMRVRDFRRVLWGHAGTPEGQEAQGNLRNAQEIGEDWERGQVQLGVPPTQEDPLQRFYSLFEEAGLEREERLLVWAQYGMGASNHEIACVIGVHESRISQLLSEIVEKMRRRLRRMK